MTLYLCFLQFGVFGEKGGNGGRGKKWVEGVLGPPTPTPFFEKLLRTKRRYIESCYKVQILDAKYKFRGTVYRDKLLAQAIFLVVHLLAVIRTRSNSVVR